MKIGKLMQSLTLLALTLGSFQVHADPEVAQYNTKFDSALKAVSNRLKAQGIAVTKIEITYVRENGGTVTGLVEISVKDMPNTARIQVNLEIGGTSIGALQVAQELLKKTGPHLPRMSMALADSPASPLKDLEKLSEEAAKKTTLLKTIKANLASGKIAPGSYYREVAKTQEAKIRAILNGVGKVEYIGVKGGIVKEALSLPAEVRLDLVEVAHQLETLKRALEFANTNRVGILDILFDEDPTLTKEMLDAQKAELAKVEKAIAKIEVVGEALRQYGEVCVKAEEAKTNEAVKAAEVTLLEAHLVHLQSIELFTKMVDDTSKRGLGQNPVSDFRKAVALCHQQAQTLAQKGLILSNLGQVAGAGAEIGEMRDQLTKLEEVKNEELRKKLNADAKELRASLSFSIEALSLELDALKRLGADRILSATELDRSKAGALQLEHLRFQMTEVTKIEASTKVRGR